MLRIPHQASFLGLILFAPLLLFLWMSPPLAAASSGQVINYRQRIEALERARELSPLDPQLRQTLAGSYLAYGLERLEKDEIAEALELLQRGRDMDPANGQFPLFIGMIQLREREYVEAELSFLEAQQQLGQSAQLGFLLAKVYYAQGRLYEAQSHLEQWPPRDAAAEEFLEKIRRELAVEENMGREHSGTFSLAYIAGGEDLGALTLEVLHRAYAELGVLFNCFPSQAIPVVLYGDRDFAVVTGAPDWAAGAYDGKIRVPVGGVVAMNEALERILYHEYAHVLIFTLARGNAPRWLDEGLAQIAEGDWLHDGPAPPDEETTPPPFSRLERSFAGLTKAEAAAAYRRSREFASYLLDRYGWPRMLDLLQALGRGEDFADASRRLLLYAGEDFAQVEKDWSGR